LRVDAVGFAGIADISEDIANVVQHDVKDDVETELVSGIDQRAELIVGIVGITGEAGIDVQKIVNAVSVIRSRLKRTILENRTQPDGACAELLDVGKLILNAGQIAALKIIVGRAIERQGDRQRERARRRERIVEAIHHEEINPLIAPVRR
jgi:hypothetical protein